MRTQVVLPADVYDTLEFSALVFGGIGHSHSLDGDGSPLCAVGHCIIADGRSGDMMKAVILAVEQDHGGPVSLWNDSGFLPSEGRISFDDWCARLNVLRGDS